VTIRSDNAIVVGICFGVGLRDFFRVDNGFVDEQIFFSTRYPSGYQLMPGSERLRWFLS
jgi:hypothetical protein